MAPVLESVTLLHDGDAYIDRTGRRYMEIWQVRFTSAATAYEARTASGLPTLGSRYSQDTAAKFLNKTAEKTGSRKVWNIKVNYVTPSEDTPEENPIDDPVQIAIDPRPRTIVVDKDNSGRAILTSAGDPFDPPYEDEESDVTLTLVRNETSADFDDIEEFNGSVNSANITIAGKVIPARGGKLTWSAAKQERNGYAYYTHTYKIDCKADLWDLQILDHGLYYLDSNGVKRRVMEDGKPADNPQLLNGSGGLLIPQPGTPSTTSGSYTIFSVGHGKVENIASLNFGNIMISRMASVSLAIINKSAAAIIITGLSGLSAPFAVTPPVPPSISMPVGSAKKTVTVTYTPQSAASHSDTLSIISAGETHNISLSGTGIAKPAEVYLTKRWRKEKAWSGLSLPTTA
jgi:hypothetical protein